MNMRHTFAESAFDLFQRATVLIARGDRSQAAAILSSAIDQIDRDGIDEYLRADLVDLRDLMAIEVAA